MIFGTLQPIKHEHSINTPWCNWSQNFHFCVGFDLNFQIEHSLVLKNKCDTTATVILPLSIQFCAKNKPGQLTHPPDKHIQEMSVAEPWFTLDWKHLMSVRFIPGFRQSVACLLHQMTFFSGYLLFLFIVRAWRKEPYTFKSLLILVFTWVHLNCAVPIRKCRNEWILLNGHSALTSMNENCGKIGETTQNDKITISIVSSK